MAKFIWTSKDKFGKPVVREITAETIEESKAILIADDCTDLTLKSEEIMDLATASSHDKKKVFGKEIKSTAEDRVRYLDNPLTFLQLLFRSVSQNNVSFLMLMLLIPIIVAFELYRGHKTIPIYAGLLLVGLLVLAVWIWMPMVFYRKLNAAKDWNRWPQVLKLVKVLKVVCWHHINKGLAFDLPMYRAVALAGLGNLTGALAESRRCENQPGMPTWFYKALLADIYDIAKDHDKGLQYIREALEEKQTPLLYLELAYRLLCYKKDTKSARDVLSEVEKSTVVDCAKPSYMLCRGILAYLEGDYTSAKRELESSLVGFEQDKHRWLMDGNINRTRAYLCCVLAKQGDLATAKNYFDRAKKYLVATGETELIEKCEGAAGE